MSPDEKDKRIQELEERCRVLEQINRELHETTGGKVAGNPCPRTACDGTMKYAGQGVSRCQVCGYRWSTDV